MKNLRTNNQKSNLFNKFNFLPLMLTVHHQPIYNKLKRTTIYLFIYSILVVLIQTFYEHMFDRLQLDHLGQFHLIFSFVLTILIGFRVNTAYSRWWEARSNWGSLVNNSRNLALKFNAYIGLNNNPQFLKYVTKFPELLKWHLRKQPDKCLEIASSMGVSQPLESNLPNIVISEMYKIINQYRNEEKIRFEQYMALDIHLANLIDITGSCEKIANTPVPSLFKVFVRQALTFYMLIFPFGWVEKFGYLIIPMIIVIVDILLGLELASESIEAPFEHYTKGDEPVSDLNLNLDNIAATIEKNILSLTK